MDPMEALTPQNGCNELRLLNHKNVKFVQNLVFQS